MTPSPIIRVEEQHDHQGDTVFVFSLATYDRNAIDLVADLTGALVLFAPTTDQEADE